jgi:hypothetical protein
VDRHHRQALSLRSGKLVDKDWYFNGSEAEATEKANAKARQWELLCKNWNSTERPYLETVGEPVPHEPRWPASSAKVAGRPLMAPELLQSIRREGLVEPDEMALLEQVHVRHILPEYFAATRDSPTCAGNREPRGEHVRQLGWCRSREWGYTARGFHGPRTDRKAGVRAKTKCLLATMKPK